MGILKQGDSGEAVRALQAALNKNGAQLVEDGDFGTNTEDALVAYQKAQGIAERVCGPLTAAKLGLGSQAPSGGRIKIIDTSGWEKDTDYAKVFASDEYQGNIAKATQADNYVDPYLDFHEKGTKDYGRGFGTFHFMDYLVPGAAQARYYFSHARGKSGLWVADVEWANGKKVLGEDGATIVEDFLEEISQLTGRLPWTYTNRNFFLGFSNPERFAKYPLWLNDFSVPLTGTPKAPAPWTSLIAHQYQYDPQQTTPVEVVPGAGKIDVSWFCGSKEDFAKECGL